MRFHRVNKRIVLVFSAMVIMVVFMLPNMATPLYATWQENIGFSSGIMTEIFAVYILGLITSLLVVGKISEYLGHKIIITSGLVFALLSCIAYLCASSIALLLVARVLTGFAVGTIVTAGIAVAVDLGGTTRINQSALLASMAIVMGAGLGPLISGFMAQTMSRPVPIIYTLMLIMVFAGLCLVQSLPLRKKVKSFTSTHYGLWFVLKENRVHLICAVAVYAPAVISSSFVAALTPSMFAHQLGVNSPLLTGASVAISFVSAALFQLLIRRFIIKSLLTGGTMLCILGLFMMAESVNLGSPYLLLASCIVSGGSMAFSQLGAVSLLAQEVIVSQRTEANSLFSLGSYIPAGIFSASSGFLIDALGLPLAIDILAGMVVFFTTLSLIYILRKCP
ncbi:TPA: MFS transporter [Citrobacter freundii]